MFIGPAYIPIESPLVKNALLTVTLLASVSLAGCATPLNSMQQSELQGYRAKGLEVTEKHPGTGAALGILPGGGSFYTRHYGLGAVNLLLWPISILWDPISGHDGAESINYYATKAHVNKKQSKEIDELDEKLELKKITMERYVFEKKKIEKKYSPDL